MHDTHSSGEFCPVHFAVTRDGLRCFAARDERWRADSRGVLIHTLLVRTDYGFDQRYIDTELIRS